MIDRRILLASIASLFGLAAFRWLRASPAIAAEKFEIEKTDAEWRALLTPQQYGTNVNFAGRGEMLNVEDVLEILSIPLLGIIPESFEVLRASNLGAPITICGREVAPAISSISSVDVFDASTQSGLAILSISPKICFLSGMLSNTASMMRST